MNQKKIAIAYFSNATTRGGAEEHILCLMRQLDRRYYRVYLICPPELAVLLTADLPADVETFELYFERVTQIGAAYRLATFLRQHQIDILHSHLFRASLVASPVAKFSGVPVTIETPHIRELWRRGFKASFFVDRLGGRFVDYYIAVSESNARYLIDEKRLPERKVRAIQNGADLCRFNPAHVAPRGMKESLGFASHDPVILFVGRLEAQKGHAVLLKALHEVRKDFPYVRLICAGDGSLRGELEQQAASLQIQESVRFVGRQSNITEWLALADFCVLPSYYEGLPLVAIESLAAGRTIVATAVDGTPEVVVDGKTGLTVPPGNSHALAAAIRRMLQEPELRRKMAHAGRDWVLARFSLDRQVQQTQELYLQACKEKAALHTSS